MNKLKTGIHNLLSLGRIGMAPLTVSVPIFGMLVAGRHSVADAAWLALIGLCAHMFGFGLNDLLDLSIDRLAQYRQHSPLVSQALSIKSAWIYVIAQVPIAFGCYFLFYHGSLNGGYILAASVMLSIVYNLWSKNRQFPRFGAELALAVSIGCLALVGSISPRGAILPLYIAFALSVTLVTLSVNSVSSGLKDLKTDTSAGVTSFALSMDCQVVDQDQLVISQKMRRYSFAVQFFILLSNLIIIRLLHVPWYWGLLYFLLFFYACQHLRWLLSRKSFKTLWHSLPLLNGYYNYLSLVVLIMPVLPGWLVWFVLLGIVIFLSYPIRAALQLKKEGVLLVYPRK